MKTSNWLTPKEKIVKIRTTPPLSVALSVAVCLPLLTVVGCDKLGLNKKKEPVAVATPAPPPKPEPPKIDYAKVCPNELGRIPILMYHEIGGPPDKRDAALVRSVEAFKKDLELLYAANFRPVNLGDVLNNNIDIPAGTSPVVITFDDARDSQFRLIDTGNALKVDPNCGVGILMDFSKTHADWGKKATFFILPTSRLKMAPFGKRGEGEQKLAFLLKQGFEIGNHTTLHKSMAHMKPDEIQKEIGNANNYITSAVPDAKISAVALPMGIYPRNKADWKYLIEGSYEGKPYKYQAALLAAYRPIISAANKDFNPLRLERIAPKDSDPNGLRNWIIKLSDAGADRFISDGDPKWISFPKIDEKKANLAKIQAEGKMANPYGGTDGGSKPIIIDGDEPATPATSEPGKSSVTEKPITGG